MVDRSDVLRPPTKYYQSWTFVPVLQKLDATKHLMYLADAYKLPTTYTHLISSHPQR